MSLLVQDPLKFLQRFRKIQEGIYDSPDDFVIIDDGSASFEPALQELWTILDRNYTGAVNFSLEEIYTALQTSNDFDHIWELFAVRYGLSQRSTLMEFCYSKAGLYRVPKDLAIIRTNRQNSIGGYSYRLLRKRAHSECKHAVSHNASREELRLADIYTGLWALNRTQEGFLPGMQTMMRAWLEDTNFGATDEGMLTRLALKLGCVINAQGLCMLLGHQIARGNYIMTQLLPYGKVGGHYLWFAKCHNQYSNAWYRPTATLQTMAGALCY